MITYSIDQLDLIATDALTVEIQREVGFTGRYKLYIHLNGKTIVRVCKLTHNQMIGFQMESEEVT